jgi:hypothetical protein
MREREEVWKDRFSSPSYEGASREFDRVENAERTAWESGEAESAHVASQHRSRARIVVTAVCAFLVAVAMLVAPAKSRAEVSFGVAVSSGPPALPIYAQPLCPGPGYIWAPGYWAWDPYYGYYWVPGTWVMAPFVGALWTPGYWAFTDGMYVWYPGYWGPVVGFYGGIDYGYGYTGYGYEGGYWRDQHFYYNRAVTNVRTTNVTYVYNRTVVNNNVTRVSYNGGPDGVRARATSAQLAAARQRRMGAVEAQQRQIQAARRNPAQRARENRGRPEVAATRRPGEFSGHGAVRATRAGAPYRAPERGAMKNERKMEANPHSMPAHPSARPPKTREPRRAEPQPPVRREGTVAPRREAPQTRRERHSNPPPSAHEERSAPPRQEAPRARHQPHASPPPQAEMRRNVGRPQATRRPEQHAHSQPHAMHQPHGNVREARGHGGNKHTPPHGFGR